MKKLLIISALLVSSIAISQTSTTPYKPYYNLGEPWQFQRFNYYGNNYEKIQDSLIKKLGVKTRKAYRVDEDKNQELISTKIYNGKDSHFDIYGMQNRKSNFRSMYHINNFRVYQWKTWGKDQKQVNEYQTINGKEFLKEKTYMTKNKIKSRTHYFWDKNGVLDSLHYFNKRENTPSKKVYYTYENNKLKETRTFINGKLKYVRKYDCTPLGKVQKKVTQTKQCVNTEFDKDGNKIVVVETTDEKGRTEKYKTTYVGKSDVVLKIEHYDYKNRLTSITEKTAEKRTFAYYKKNGKESYKQILYYDQNKNIVKEERYNNGELNHSQKSTYNAQGLVTKIIFVNKKGEERIGSTYEYNSNGLRSKTTYYGKKKNKVYTYTYSM